MPAGHYFNLSKHGFKEKIGLLKKVEDIITEHTKYKNARVYIPITEEWDGVVYIPDAKVTLEELTVEIGKYYEIEGAPTASLDRTEIWLPLPGNPNP